MPHGSPDIVWITGASSGLGAALARVYAESGARCVLSARSEDGLERTRLACRDPDRHLVLPMDVTRNDTHAELVERVYAEMGRVDVLVLNSGISQRAGALETGMDVVRRFMEVNYFGAVSHARLVVPRMVEHGSGRVVVISSVLGRVGIAGRSAYAASKHALHGWFDSLRAEVADAGVQVTIVCPGYVRTALPRMALRADGSRHDRMDATHQRGLDPDDCARAVVRAVRRGRAEYHVGMPEILAIQIFRFFPWLFRRLFRGYRPEEHA